MSDMRLVVMGAAGRMGRMLVRTIGEMPGVAVAAALERAGSDALGKDAGVVAGLPPVGVPITDDPLQAVVNADGIVDFTAPAASVELAALAAQARIVHVIGTTGLSPSDLKKIDAAARHAVVVRSGNMSLWGQPARRAGQARRRVAWAGLGHRNSGDASQDEGRCAVRHCASARRKRGARPQHRSCRALRAQPRRPYRRAARRRHRLCDITWRHVVGDHR